MLYKSLPFLNHLHFMSSRDANEFKRFSCYLKVGTTTANTVTTATQTDLELQENHPKFLWARQRPLPPSKSVRSQLFFRPSAGPPLQPLVRDPRSATPLIINIKHVLKYCLSAIGTGYNTCGVIFDLSVRTDDKEQ
jgi:hypothetical protein